MTLASVYKSKMNATAAAQIAHESFESAHQNMIDTYPEIEQNQELLRYECVSAVADNFRWIDDEGTSEFEVMSIIDELVRNSGY